MFMKWESVVKKMFPLFATFVKSNKQFFRKNTFFCMLVWCIFLLKQICYSRMIKIDKYFVSLEIESDVVEKWPFFKGLGRWYFTLF